MNDLNYLPEPGGDLIIYATSELLVLVHLRGDRAQRCYSAALGDDGLPVAFRTALKRALDRHAPTRMTVSIGVNLPPVHVLSALTRVVRVVAWERDVTIVEAPDIVRVAEAILHCRAEDASPRVPPHELGPPPGVVASVPVSFFSFIRNLYALTLPGFACP